MPQSVKAVYEDGVLRPLDRLRGIAEHGEVKLIVRDARSSDSLAERLGALSADDAEGIVHAIERELDQNEIDAPDRASEERETIQELGSFLRLVACVTDLDQLRSGWNTYAAEAPGRRALKTSLRILRVLHSTSCLPDRVLPLADGGVALVYSRGSLYGSIECFNDGDVSAGISNRSDVHEAWDVEPARVADSARRISAFLNG